MVQTKSVTLSVISSVNANINQSAIVTQEISDVHIKGPDNCPIDSEINVATYYTIRMLRF